MSNTVPKLRFKEFKDTWVFRKLEDITEKVNSGKTPLGGESVYVSSGVLFIRSQNVLDDRLSLDNVTYITEEVNSSMLNSVVKPKDILLNITGASLGRSCVVPESFIIGNVNQHVCIVRLNKNNEPYFLQPIFASKKGQNLFESLQTGSGREGLNFQSIKAISFAFPSLPEQQKIASFLSAVDEKIQQLIRKKEGLEQYKKGVMQQLFSGKLRFKDENGKAFSKWEIKKLGDIGNVIRGASPRPQGDKRYYGGQIPRLMVKDVTRDGKYVTPNTDFLTEEGAKLSRPCKAGTLTIVCSGTVGIPSFLAVDACIHDGFLALIDIDPCYNPDYIYHNLTTLREKFESSATHGGVFTNLTTSAIKDFKVVFPSLLEQQKIANFLTALDTKIESVAAQIAHTKTFKKGLLQQMFV